MGGRGIYLSPKHGVNPTLGTCFWCGGDTGELALLGRITKPEAFGLGAGERDPEAPRHLVLSYEPCAKCVELLEHGVHFVEVTEDDPGDRPPLPMPGVEQGGRKFKVWPTGRHFAVKKDAAERLPIQPREFLAEIIEQGKCVLPRDAYEKIGQLIGLEDAQAEAAGGASS